MELRECPDCGRLMPKWRRRHVCRTCPPYSELWAGDQRRKIFAALHAYADSTGVGDSAAVAMITITAPGQEAGLTWDRSVCGHVSGERCSGPDGCRVRSDAAATWNGLAPGWWRTLHHEAKQAAERRTGAVVMMLLRVWEMQRRGLLHAHVTVGCTSPAERIACLVYQQELAARAAAQGFGFVDRKQDVREPSAAAAYLSSYFVSGRKGKLSLTESVRQPDMPPSIIYVAPWLTQRSGLTMRSLRLVRFLYCRIGAGWQSLLDVVGLAIEDAFELIRHGFFRAFCNTVLAQAP